MKLYSLLLLLYIFNKFLQNTVFKKLNKIHITKNNMFQLFRFNNT